MLLFFKWFFFLQNPIIAAADGAPNVLMAHQFSYTSRGEFLFFFAGPDNHAIPYRQDEFVSSISFPSPSFSCVSISLNVFVVFFWSFFI